MATARSSSLLRLLRGSAVAALAALLLLGPAPSGATVLLTASLDDLARVSSAVVRGQVLEVTPVRIGGRIETRVTMAVDRVYRGTADETVELVVEGGRLGNLVSRVAGAAAFSVGDQVVVFCERRSDGQLTPTGMSLGVFRLVTGTDGVERAVRQLDGLSFVSLDDAGRVVPAHSNPQPELSGPAFESWLEGLSP
jgi:hypothetical protein